MKKKKNGFQIDRLYRFKLILSIFSSLLAILVKQFGKNTQKLLSAALTKKF
jgi:hypothetical protein